MKKTQKLPQIELPKPGRKRVGKLNSANDVSRFIARCIRQTVGGGEENKNYKLVMMASMLLKALEVSSLEARIDRLESKIEGKEPAKPVS